MRLATAPCKRGLLLPLLADRSARGPFLLGGSLYHDIRGLELASAKWELKERKWFHTSEWRRQHSWLLPCLFLCQVICRLLLHLQRSSTEIGQGEEALIPLEIETNDYDLWLHYWPEK